MAQLQDGKRTFPDEPSLGDQEGKKAKLSADQADRDSLLKETDPTQETDTPAAPEALDYSPSYWEKLSKVWFTPSYLRETHRRNRSKSSARHSAPPAGLTSCTTRLDRFARQGGPDLCHLRGFLAPEDPVHSRGFVTMVENAFGKNFEQHLMDHSIWPFGGLPQCKPRNMDQILQALAVPRKSNPLSLDLSSTFMDFCQENDRALSKQQVLTSVLPQIAGQSSILKMEKLRFSNLASITGDKTVCAWPDSYDGVHPRDLDMRVRQDLGKTIVPTSFPNALVAPNFFIETSGPSGDVRVLRRKACLDGALSARAMHSLQNYGEEQVFYDGSSFAFTSTYNPEGGLLWLYAHHVTAGADGVPEYHMTPIRAYALTSDPETFLAGVTAFRNLRDLAQRNRNSLIDAANSRAYRQD